MAALERGVPPWLRRVKPECLEDARLKHRQDEAKRRDEALDRLGSRCGAPSPRLVHNHALVAARKRPHDSARQRLLHEHCCVGRLRFRRREEKPPRPQREEVHAWLDKDVAGDGGVFPPPGTLSIAVGVITGKHCPQRRNVKLADEALSRCCTWILDSAAPRLRARPQASGAGAGALGPAGRGVEHGHHADVGPAHEAQDLQQARVLRNLQL
mmetsp:Transcript_83947/g.237847  ORF Transcript_83947/g.237847 Transcript_83947/m.237847 type:complete len:212 (-) Transcript_83947:1172-1807(-)